MIPREILKKIRQIEVRINRLEIETLVYFSFQPLAQFLWISRGVENRNDANVVRLNVKVDALAAKPSEQPRLAGCWSNEAEAFRIFLNFLNDAIDFSFKCVAQTRLLVVIPGNRFIKFQTGDGRENDFALHAARRAFKRCLASARTCSHGIPALGFFRSSSARRSNSAICSGVSLSSKSPNSSSMVSTSSRRSASGILRSSSRISVLLMTLIYLADFLAQAWILARANSSFVIRHSSFPCA